ncbi:hypothetical protein Syun_013410 [Stephania yunnanensis]|uniref:SCP domain-containing protein n=1 Tax=Stephania yunnanensis TaxID=152371 RepID=A0AAP0PJT7_9MAGN
MPTHSRPLILLISIFLLLALVAAKPYHMRRYHQHRPLFPHRRRGGHHKHGMQQQKQTSQLTTRSITSSSQQAATNAMSKSLGAITKRVPRTERRQFLYEHNMVRKQHNEPPLAWNKTLMWYARAYAKKRVGDCEMTHSSGPYGENIYWGSEFDRHSATDAVRAWAGEATDYNKGSNECAQGKMCGHYTQMVWKDSTSVGCARARCADGGAFVICSYDPPGNYVGESPFGVKPSGSGGASSNDGSMVPPNS